MAERIIIFPTGQQMGNRVFLEYVQSVVDEIKRDTEEVCSQLRLLDLQQSDKKVGLVK